MTQDGYIQIRIWAAKEDFYTAVNLHILEFYLRGIREGFTYMKHVNS